MCARRAALSIALAAAVAGTDSPPLAAAGPLRPFATAEVRIDQDLDLAVESDTRRWYAYQLRRGRVLAVDTRSGKRLAIATPSTCSLRDVRLSLLLLACVHEPVARLVTLPGRARTDFADIDERTGQPFEDGFVAIGRYWLGGFTCDANTRCGQVYLNRRTHKRRFVDSSEQEDPNVLLGDVDTPGLELKDPSLRVDMRSGAYRLTEGSDPTAPLVLRHRGRRRTLSRCPHMCMFPTISGSLVTWSEGRIVYGYALRSRKSTRWRVPFEPPSAGFVTAVVHTTRLVLIRTTGPGDSPTSNHEVLYRASVPKRR